MDVDYSPTGREFVAGSYDRSGAIREGQFRLQCTWVLLGHRRPCPCLHIVIPMLQLLLHLHHLLPRPPLPLLSVPAVRIFSFQGGHSRDIYHTKRMQRVFATRFSGDGTYIFSGGWAVWWVDGWAWYRRRRLEPAASVMGTAPLGPPHPLPPTHPHHHRCTGSDDMNVRVWKANASEQLGTLLPRERKRQQYNAALVERHRHLPGGLLVWVGSVAMFRLAEGGRYLLHSWRLPAHAICFEECTPKQPATAHPSRTPFHCNPPPSLQRWRALCGTATCPSLSTRPPSCAAHRWTRSGARRSTASRTARPAAWPSSPLARRRWWRSWSEPGGCQGWLLLLEAPTSCFLGWHSCPCPVLLGHSARLYICCLFPAARCPPWLPSCPASSPCRSPSCFPVYAALHSLRLSSFQYPLSVALSEM